MNWTTTVSCTKPSGAWKHLLSSMIFTRVERHWFAFIFHISPRNSKSSWDCSTSKRSNLRGTPGASRIFCSVGADQLLANPPGYAPRKIVFKLKKTSLNGMVYLVNGYVFIQRRRSLYTKMNSFTQKFFGVFRVNFSMESWRLHWPMSTLLFYIYHSWILSEVLISWGQQPFPI